MSISNYALSRSIVPAAAYIAASSELEAGILPNNHTNSMRFDSDFVPSDLWQKAARDLYFAIANSIGSLVQDYQDTGDLPAGVDYDAADAWSTAHAEDHFADGGWAHRIVNVMQATARANGGADLGDYSFDLIIRAVSEGRA